MTCDIGACPSEDRMHTYVRVEIIRIKATHPRHCRRDKARVLARVGPEREPQESLRLLRESKI